MGRLAGAGLKDRLGGPVSRFGGMSVEQGPRGRRSISWYNTKRWRDARKRVLQRDGYVCQQTGVALVGKHPAPNSPVCDHKVPHRGDEGLFWDENNMQAVSKEWHDRVKQGQEKRGEVQ